MAIIPQLDKPIKYSYEKIQELESENAKLTEHVKRLNKQLRMIKRVK